MHAETSAGGKNKCRDLKMQEPSCWLDCLRLPSCYQATLMWWISVVLHSFAARQKCGSWHMDVGGRACSTELTNIAWAQGFWIYSAIFLHQTCRHLIYLLESILLDKSNSTLHHLSYSVPQETLFRRQKSDDPESEEPSEDSSTSPLLLFPLDRAADLHSARIGRVRAETTLPI